MKILLGVAIAAGIGCAHAANSKETKVFVTGSHIPQSADPSGNLRTFAPLRVYSRAQLAETGREFYLDEALRELDPSVR